MVTARIVSERTRPHVATDTVHCTLSSVHCTLLAHQHAVVRLAGCWLSVDSVREHAQRTFMVYFPTLRQMNLHIVSESLTLRPADRKRRRTAQSECVRLGDKCCCMHRCLEVDETERGVALDSHCSLLRRYVDKIVKATEAIFIKGFHQQVN